MSTFQMKSEPEHECRICMSFDYEMTNILDDSLYLMDCELVRPLSQIFEEIIGISISLEDNLTSFLCNMCANRLKDAALLKLQAEKSYKALMEKQCKTEPPPSPKDQPFEFAGYKIIELEEPQTKVNKKQNFTEEETATNIIQNFLSTSMDLEKDISQKQLNKLSSLYRCKICNHGFPSRPACYNHIDSHIQPKTKRCPTCESNFPKMIVLKQHLTGTVGDPPNVCKICSKIFCHSYKMLEHSRIHTDECPNVCYICFKAFSTVSGLTEHMRSHANIFFTCEICNKRISTLNTYLLHLSKHKILPGYLYGCHLCYRKFESVDELRNHINVHLRKGTISKGNQYSAENYNQIEQKNQKLIKK